MAREEESEERYLEEMPSCLRDLFEQTSCEQDECFANNASSSAKSYKSVLEISGMKLPPPLLTEQEKAEMRQYRREAVKCETRLFERRREKYSDLILQVMSVMDRIQEQREAKTMTETQQQHAESLRERTLTNEIGEPTDTSRTLQQGSLQSASHEPDYRRHAWDVPGTGRVSQQEQFPKSFTDWTENKGDQSRRVNSQLGYLPDSIESMLTTSDESGIIKHQFPRKVDSRDQIKSASLRSEGMDFPLSSTVDKDISALKRPFSQLSFASNGMFSDTALDSSVRNKSVSFEQDRKGLQYDSLASTSLSVAFSDSSNSTVHSVIETQHRPPTVQQQIPMDSATSDSHYRNYHEKQSSAAQTKHPKTSTTPVLTKQKSEKQKPQSTRQSNGHYISEQDKTLANLEKLRQRLLEEKQKHLDALKQQELTRLRKQQKELSVELDHSYASSHSCSTPTHMSERPRSSSMPSTRTSDLKQSPFQESEHSHVIDRSSPLRRPLSLPPGEMYSILELSGENLDFDIHDHNTEPESSSDKENHVINGDLSVNRSDAVADIVQRSVTTDVTTRMRSGKSAHPSTSQRSDHKTTVVPRERYKFFESNGRDKFAKLSAHAKGFLTRLLMKTDKVQGLVKTIKDTRDVLEEMSREDTQSLQEKMMKENLESHLKAARGSLHDVFFTVPVKERMSYIAHSRNIARAKEAKRVTRSSAAQSKLSAVTLRAIQRRQEGLDHQSSVTETDVKPKPGAREERKRKNWNIRVLKPQQGHTSPTLPDKTRSRKQISRPTTAPERPLNSRMHKAEDTSKRPQTAETVREKPERPSRVSLGGGNSNKPANRLGRKSLGGISQQPKMVRALGNANRSAKPAAKKRLSLPASAQPRIRAHDGTSDAMQRPQTASETKRNTRTLAANFAK